MRWLLLVLVLGGCADAPAEARSEPAPTPETAAAREPEPAPDNAVPPFARESRFCGEPDWARRHALATQPVTQIEKGRGGRSLAFKLTLADGTRGYYKPEQTFSAAHWYAEVASYYLDRELGIGRAIPTIGRRLEWEPLRRAAGSDRRVDEVVVQEDGTVRGAFIWWVPEDLVPIAPGTGWEKWIRVTGPLRVTPYQRPRRWADGEVADHGPPAGAPDTPERPAELSDMILFDYLTTNVDRWGGDFTNVRTRGPGGPIIYLDNGAGFTAGPSARIPLMDARLHALQRFRRSTVERIRALDLDRLERRMAEDPLAPVLTERHFEQLEERRRHLLEHVAAMEKRFGDRAFPWP